MQSYKVKERKRTICFEGGYKANFHNVTEVMLDGNWLRFNCDEGFLLLNPEKILYIQIDAAEIS